MGVEYADAGDSTVIADADKHVNVICKSADQHFNDYAVVTAVYTGDAAVGAGILFFDIFAAAGQHITEYFIKFGLLVGFGSAGKGCIGPENDESGDKDDCDGYEQLFGVHLPAPPFTTPKRLMGNALSSAQAQAFIMSMA